eukprot:TRINITY_DN114501_c0_g1_i1.p1 TRINITY_DN114501_c0_g1~~TRINITY_DN114501_c0_g1_i1.p1  ORF type:complete len:199 (+),score=35.36 TRINITY_DN114501_c0_g1_i1:35-631(+)
MPAAAATGTPVYAYLTFHVRNVRLAAFCEAAADLLTASEKDKGRLKMDLHREMPWVRAISNDEFSLFMMAQAWASAPDLEAHTRAKHSLDFNRTVMQGKMLVTEPSVSIFGEPLSPTQLAELGAQAFAGRAAAEIEAVVESSQPAAASPSALPSLPPLAASGKPPLPMDSTMRSSRSSSMSRTGSSVLQNSGAIALHR